MKNKIISELLAVSEGLYELKIKDVELILYELRQYIDTNMYSEKNDMDNKILNKISSNIGINISDHSISDIEYRVKSSLKLIKE
ncbi:hypothetical protein UT300012_32680 [Paraclostridium bifermentans]